MREADLIGWGQIGGRNYAIVHRDQRYHLVADLDGDGIVLREIASSPYSDLLFTLVDALGSRIEEVVNVRHAQPA